MLYTVWTIGCQMNKADSERVASALESAGWRPAPDGESADLVILNTCVVRGSAERRVEGKLGALKGLKRQRPGSFVAVMGCFVPPQRDALAKRFPQVDHFFTVHEIPQLMQSLETRAAPVADAAAELAAQVRPHASTRDLASLGPAGQSSVSRYVPIIYGCNNFCAYCIVPFRRGRERSRPPGEILAELRAMVAGGAREVTLLGQNVDAYRFDDPDNLAGPALDLAGLLELVSREPGLVRVRFLTSHPRDMTDRLMAAVADLPRVCPAINLPVQSGDDAILHAMGRGYTSAGYRGLIERIRARIPGVALTTDLIVGFPGETLGQFENSMRLLAEIRFDAVHVAAYSPREGTRAAGMQDDVPPEEKSRRLHAVESLQTTISGEISAALLGKTIEVLVEDLHRGKWMGRTRTDKIVFFTNESDVRGRLVNVRITKSSPWSLHGDLDAIVRQA